MVATPARIDANFFGEGARSPDRGGSTSGEEFFAYGRSAHRKDARARYRYIGVERDEDTGLCMTGPRTYDPVVGRFHQGDPLNGGPPFVYSRGNPIRRMDGNGYQDVPAPVAPTPEAQAPAPTPPDTLPDWLTQGNAAGAAAARAGAERLKGIVTTPEAIQRLQSLPITDPDAKSRTIAQVVSLPFKLEQQAEQGKVRGLSTEEFNFMVKEGLLPAAAGAAADAASGMTYVTKPSTFQLAHETSHHLTGPSASADPLATAIHNVNTEITAAYVDYAVLKLAGPGDLSDAASYVAKHGSVSHSLEGLGEALGTAAHPSQAAVDLIVARGFMVETDIPALFPPQR